MKQRRAHHRNEGYLYPKARPANTEFAEDVPFKEPVFSNGRELVAQFVFGGVLEWNCGRWVFVKSSGRNVRAGARFKGEVAYTIVAHFRQSGWRIVQSNLSREAAEAAAEKLSHSKRIGPAERAREIDSDYLARFASTPTKPRVITTSRPAAHTLIEH